MVENKLSRKINILHVIEGLREFGGTPAKLLYQVQNSSSRFHFIMCCMVMEGTLAAKFRDAGADVVSLRFEKNYEIRQLIQLMRVIRTSQADIVHTHFARSNAYGRIAGILCRKPVITSEHGIQRNHSLPVRFLDNLLNPFTAHIVCNSYATLKSVGSSVRLNRKNISVIYNGVPDLFEQISTMPKDHFKQAQGFDKKDFIILDVGSHIPLRSHITLIKAADRLRDAIPEMKIVFVGDGETRSSLECAVRDLGLDEKIKFLGKIERERVHKLMPSADLYVNPAVSEGFGIATVEAMLCELPVICSNSGSLPELINYGVEGLLFRPMDEESLSRKILGLYKSKDLQRTLGKAARKSALKRFSVKGFVEAFENIYLSMI